MPDVTVELDGIIITISPRDEKKEGSVDLSAPKWSETSIWDVRAIKAALKQLDEQQGTKHVNCMQGQNRSPTMAILYLWSRTRRTLREVFDAVALAFTKTPDAKLGGDGSGKKVINLLEQLLLAYAEFGDGSIWNLRYEKIPGNILGQKD